MTALQEIKAAQEDYEWYPTTNEILNRLGECLDLYHHESKRFLDIGAGNGKVLDYVSEIEGIGKCYAIEKSQTHLSSLKSEYFILGVDFYKTQLYDKQLDYIFVNPPYSEYEEWVCRVIREACDDCQIYLVIPQRWQNSQRIQDELSSRKLTAKVEGEFTFEDAEDRKARAKVHLVYVEVKKEYDKNDPFTKFFDETFTYPKKKEEKPFEEKIQQGLAKKRNFIEVLCDLYDARMLELQKNYQSVCELDPDLLREFEISKVSMIESLKMKLEATKKEYWQRLFDGMSEINKRLTHDSRKKICDLMNGQTGVDFNIENAYAIVLWVIKNANQYFDDQFVDTYETMVEYANIDRYKSNERVFKKNEFTYWSRRDSVDPVTHYKLKVGNRIVLDRCGGLDNSEWSWKKGLTERAAQFIGDIMTIANNMDFIPERDLPKECEWDTSEAQVFYCHERGEKKVLFRVRAFLNGNLHFQFLPEFVHAMNVKFGSLKGWVHAGNAAQETEAPTEIVEKYFDYQFQIGYKQLLLS